MTGREL